METRIENLIKLWKLSFYPTYEEWKHVSDVMTFTDEEVFLSYL